MKTGEEVYFLTAKKAGDVVMGEFYDRMTDDPDRSTYPDIPTGMRRLTEDKHVMRVSEISLKSFLMANQHTQPPVRVFGPERP